ncbi:hypothetical protein ON010_g11587 [Phytophthora cinnamomi]|nr:hypothetical protein ON010_g11587 [Phytophthora cinnamomi]
MRFSVFLALVIVTFVVNISFTSAASVAHPELLTRLMTSPKNSPEDTAGPISRLNTRQKEKLSLMVAEMAKKDPGKLAKVVTEAAKKDPSKLAQALGRVAKKDPEKLAQMTIEVAKKNPKKWSTFQVAILGLVLSIATYAFIMIWSK